jgi:hypothetical protein
VTDTLAAISRLDDGLALDGDRELALIFDRHASAVEHRRETALDVTPAGFCPLHGERLDRFGDCGTCFLDHDRYVQRCEDI